MDTLPNSTINAENWTISDGDFSDSIQADPATLPAATSVQATADDASAQIWFGTIPYPNSEALHQLAISASCGPDPATLVMALSCQAGQIDTWEWLLDDGGVTTLYTHDLDPSVIEQIYDYESLYLSFTVTGTGRDSTISITGCKITTPDRQQHVVVCT